MSRRLRPFECIFVTAVAFASVISTSARSLESVDEFQRWVSLHDRIYDNQSELVYRQQVFQANKQKIDANNERQHSFKVPQRVIKICRGAAICIQNSLLRGPCACSWP